MRSIAPILRCLSAAALLGCSLSGRQQPEASESVYRAAANIDGYTIYVELFHNHEFLAEYRKVVRVERDGMLLGLKEYQDPGGLASFYLLRAGTRITVVDGLMHGFVLDLVSGSISDLDGDAVPRDFPKRSFGRFTFVRRPELTYRWVVAEKLPEGAK